MTPHDILQQALAQLSGMDAEAFALSADYWQPRVYQKGEYYNEYKNVCKHLGFVLDGVFRTYYVHGETGEEKNVFFFTKYQVVVAYKSFVTQTPCSYFTESMTDSTVLYIHIDRLKELYAKSPQWERVGRIIAELAFSVAMERAESFMFQTAEERYRLLVDQHPEIFDAVPLYHISSYLGIQGPSLSRIRRRMLAR